MMMILLVRKGFAIFADHFVGFMAQASVFTRAAHSVRAIPLELV
jgi:hypothetical protein